MANRRMFSLDVVDTDRFLDMSASAQALYFHLGMRADDDGFVSSPRKIAKASNCGLDDLTLLAAKGFIIEKNRQGILSTEVLRFDGDNMQFIETDESIKEAAKGFRKAEEPTPFD